MDTWFTHADIIEKLEEYRSRPDILIPVYSELKSVLETEKFVLLSVKSKDIKSYITVDGFQWDITDIDKPFTRDTPRGRKFLRRIHNRVNIFPDAEQGISNYFRITTQDILAHKKVTYTEGRHKEELALRKEIIQEDLKINCRKGLLCFEIFRYSEKTLSEIGCIFKDETNQSEHHIYERFCRDIDSRRFRMKSVSAIYGRIII